MLIAQKKKARTCIAGEHQQSKSFALAIRSVLEELHVDQVCDSNGFNMELETRNLYIVMNMQANI